MTRPIKIVIDLPAYESGVKALRRIPGCQVKLVEQGAEDEVRALDPQLIADADVLFCSVPPANLALMRELRWVQIASTGYAQLLGLHLGERGVRATNSRGCFDVPIAEWNMSMMVNLVRNARRLLQNQEAAIWDRAAAFQGEIRGLTVGLWGYGGIARETARLARMMGLKVHVLTRDGVRPRPLTYCVPDTGDEAGVCPTRVFRRGDELEFLRGLDFLIVAMPLTGLTEGLIGERELRAMRSSAYLLNPARGPIVAEQALLRALRENWIAGAALDTHYQYPLPPQHPLWRMPNVIMTPHISGSSLNPHFEARLWDLFIQNVERYASGQELMNELTEKELSGG